MKRILPAAAGLIASFSLALCIDAVLYAFSPLKAFEGLVKYISYPILISGGVAVVFAAAAILLQRFYTHAGKTGPNGALLAALLLGGCAVYGLVTLLTSTQDLIALAGDQRYLLLLPRQLYTVHIVGTALLAAVTAALLIRFRKQIFGNKMK